MAGLTKKGEVYYALFSEHGKTKWIRIGRMPYTKARAALRKLESDHEQDRLELIRIVPVTFDKLAERYLDYCKANKASATYTRDKISIKNLSRYFGGKLLQAITNESIELYKARRQGEGVKNRTINLELLALSSMLRKAIEWRCLASLPKIKMLPKQKKPPRYLTKGELETFLAYATPWLLLILLVLRNAGLRSKQLRELMIPDADFDSDLLTIINTKTGDYYSLAMTYELRETLLFLRDHYVTPQGKVLPRQKHQMRYFFCLPNGEPIKSIRTSFNKAVKKAGLENVTPHTMRHTFASHLVMAGVDLPTVKELLGHSSIATTMIYAHLSVEHKAAAVRKLPWLVRKEEDKE